MRLRPSRTSFEYHAAPALAMLICAGMAASVGFISQGRAQTTVAPAIKVEPARDLGVWQGWGSSLSWWARAIGGTANADDYADLIYTRKTIGGYPALGLNIVRYNVGGGGIDQKAENKGSKLQWQMDIHGYWTDPNDTNPAAWDWSVDQNQRTIMQMARKRGANIFELFSDSPMWWMDGNHSTAGGNGGGNCLRPEDYDKFAFYLASVARHASDRWGIRFAAVEPFNEPSADWWKFPGRQEGCHLDVATQQKIVAKLRRSLDRANLKSMPITAADENNMDAGLRTWEEYTLATRHDVGFVSVHGYSNGSTPYVGPNRSELRRAVRGKRIWLSEYGDGDASGYTMAEQIVRDVKDLRPTAWVYWQPVEPDAPGYGWGLINAKYVDTHDRQSAEKTPLVRFNRKFFVYGQFTRYVRPGYHMIAIGDPNAIAAYTSALHKLVIIKISGDAPEAVTFDLSAFAVIGNTVRVIATTTAPGNEVPDWRAHAETIPLEEIGGRNLVAASLYPKSIYTFVITAKRQK